MNRQIVKANVLLSLAALIWGSTFAAQKLGMENLGPFWYTALRFLLGTLIVAPLLWRERVVSTLKPRDWATGVGIGLLLFSGINLQQVALQYTSLANSGFITGLYVVFVPVLGLFFGQRYGFGVWTGVTLAVIGLYLLSVKGDPYGLTMNRGDVLTLISAMIWAIHLIALSGFGHCLPPVRLAVTQFVTCAVLSLLVAACIEPISLPAIQAAAIPVLYGGVLSVGIGFTVQVLAQRHARAAHSAIILSLEAVVAAVVGWLILDETLGLRAIIGCTLMLAGALLAQLAPQRKPSA
ncbi:MAG: DMT family transporter [Proteobacteria bacterium]|nr:DMT family transporter [Pseudomonadota bacterium]